MMGDNDELEQLTKSTTTDVLKRRPINAVRGDRRVLVVVITGCFILLLWDSLYRWGSDRYPSRCPQVTIEKNTTSGERPKMKNDGVFYSDYSRVECQSCPNAEELIDPRAPLAVIGGAMKGGTRTLLTYLSEHPDVYSEQGHEVHFFDNRINGILKKKKSSSSITTIQRCDMLQVYEEIFQEKLAHQKDTPKTANTTGFQKYFFDKSPTYLTNSHIVPQRVLCMFPKTAKVIFVLRDPISRSYSHYQHLKKREKKFGETDIKPFEAYIDSEMEIFKSTGLLEAASLSPKEEYEAYVRYVAWKQFQLGRGLYAIQLRQWIKAFIDHFGRDDFQNHLLILDSNQLHADKQNTFDQVLDFLGLDRYTLADTADFHVGTYEPMANATRDRLVAFFRPHNQKLVELLSPFGINMSWANTGAAL
jgi:hypothetical protein